MSQNVLESFTDFLDCPRILIFQIVSRTLSCLNFREPFVLYVSVKLRGNENIQGVLSHKKNVFLVFRNIIISSLFT